MSHDLSTADRNIVRFWTWHLIRCPHCGEDSALTRSGIVCQDCHESGVRRPREVDYVWIHGDWENVTLPLLRECWPELVSASLADAFEQDRRAAAGTERLF